ncbi:hypothetical protein HNO89_004058 [Sporosarcina luteola]|nr:hypothetical protein [Sporosarcina luteola]
MHLSFTESLGGWEEVRRMYGNKSLSGIWEPAKGIM